MLPVHPPFPTAWKRPFHPVRGNQTSILMSESRDGVSVAATRQKPGSVANRRVRAAGTRGGLVDAIAPGATCSTTVIAMSGSLRFSSDSQEAPSAEGAAIATRIARAVAAVSNRAIYARILARSAPTADFG